MRSIHTAIIGGGAAGLCAAVQLARGGVQPVELFEKAPRVGRKLLATGNGTCNITNRNLAPRHYHGGDPHFSKPALTAFTDRDTVAFFASIGVDCVAEPDGRMYPRSRQAGSVLDCLRMAAQEAGAVLHTDCPVRTVRPQKHGFVLDTPQGAVTAQYVLVAAGGAASPSLGGGNDGYTLLTALGHTRTFLFPTIVQLRTDTTFVKAVKGIRVDAGVTLTGGGKTARSTGEVLFTEYGLSGPAVMAISRLAGDWERRKKGLLSVSLDLLPDLPPDKAAALVQQRRRFAAREAGDLLTGLLHKRVGQTLMRAAGIALSTPVGALTDDDAARVAALIKRWTLPVTGTQGLSAAQATAGGIDTRGFDPATLQSRLVPGLYAAGEVLDVDGDCGGYNLQWAWSSAAAAARHIIRTRS